MNPIAVEVKEIVQRLAILQRDLVAQLQASPSMVKRVPFFSCIPFEWTVPDMSLRTVPWVNGAEDVYISGITYAARNTQVSDDMIPAEGGLTGSFIGAPSTGAWPAFDFEWNYTLPSSGTQYVSQAGGGAYADRRALGIGLKGEPLSFRDPLVVPAGDNMVWAIRPTAYCPHPIQTTGTVTLTIIIFGYQTGTMAEADYDRR